MNRQARVVGFQDWSDYGKVTLFEAGRREAMYYASTVSFKSRDYLDIDIETRDADDEAIPVSVNTYRVTFNAEVLNGRKGCDDE